MEELARTLSRFRVALWIGFFYLTLRNFGEIRGFLVMIFGGLPDDMTLRMIVVYIFLLVAVIAHLSIWKTILWSGFFLVVASNLGQIFNFLNSVIIKLGVEPQYTYWVWLILGIILLAWILSWLGFTDRDIAVMTYLNILFK